MNKIQFLCRYHNMQIKIAKKKRLIAEYERLAGSLPPINYDRIGSNPSPSNTAYFEKWVIHKIDTENEVKRMENEIEGVKREILSAISTIKDDELEMILMYRYIDWLDWNTIAEKIYTCVRTAQRKHDKAIDKLILPQ